MKKRITVEYVCEHCGKTLASEVDMAAHEAAHMGITLLAYREYDRLKRDAEQAAYARERHNCADTRHAESTAIKRLCDFERAHKIK